MTREEVLEAQLAEACDRIRQLERDVQLREEERVQLSTDLSQARAAAAARYSRARKAGVQL